jgi:hypothetical protein
MQEIELTERRFPLFQRPNNFHGYPSQSPETLFRTESADIRGGRIIVPTTASERRAFQCEPAKRRGGLTR